MAYKNVPAPCTPELGYEQSLHSWFVLEGTVYATGFCVPEVFTAFVRDCSAGYRWTDREIPALLTQNTLDSFERWYILCSLLDAHIPVLLYASKQLALESWSETDSPA